MSVTAPVERPEAGKYLIPVAKKSNRLAKWFE
jgi:hypothetical protein